jgi:hypothetical protein
MLASIDLRPAAASGASASGSPDGDGGASGPSDGGDGSGGDDATAPMDADLPEGSAPLPRDLVVDASGLPGDLLRAGGGEARKKKQRELEDGIDALGTRLDETVPNLKAPQEYETVLQQEATLRQVRTVLCTPGRWQRRGVSAGPCWQDMVCSSMRTFDFSRAACRLEPHTAVTLLREAVSRR